MVFLFKKPKEGGVCLVQSLNSVLRTPDGPHFLPPPQPAANQEHQIPVYRWLSPKTGLRNTGLQFTFNLCLQKSQCCEEIYIFVAFQVHDALRSVS